MWYAGRVLWLICWMTSVLLAHAPSPLARTKIHRYDYPLGSTYEHDAVAGPVGRSSTLSIRNEIPTVGPAAEIAYACGPAQKEFTGKERDSETGLDYSLYRYSSAAQGRWTSPDPLPGWPSDPQSWNRYAYVRNNPLKYLDPLGLSYEVCDTQGNCTKKDISDDDFNKLKRSSKSDYYANGKVFHRNDDGSVVQTGTYRRTGDDLDDRAVTVLTGLERRADASNKLIATVAAGSTAVGVAGGAFVGLTGLSSGGVTTLTTGGEAVGIEGLTADQVALVSRWGRSGLQPGDWVMNGGTGVLTYLMSGKWQPGLGNVFAPFTSGQNYLVPKAAVQNPGWVENGLGWIKSLLGQRLFNP